MNNCRENGRNALSTCLNLPKNISIIETSIFKKSNGDEAKYNNLIYQCIGCIVSGIKLTEVMNELKNDRVEWDDIMYDEHKLRQNEEDDFIENPFQVEEGVLECYKCGSKRTISYTKQTRSADEPASVIATCINCKNKWVYSG
jgi:DNA-directed RNA polymerase subunit M/transcription elongation factor TFIIS